MISFNQMSKVFSFQTNKKYCIEIEFLIIDNEKYNECWMGKIYDSNIGKDTYWFGLTPDGMNAYDYASFEEMSEASVFDGKSLRKIWNHVEIISIDGCEPQERLKYYLK